MIFGITGANGFVGSHLKSFLKTKGECKVFDRDSYNLLNVDSMRQFVENKDFIFHLAGLNRAPDDELIKINTIGTMNLMEAVRKYSPGTKIIFASSMQVYGLSSKLVYYKENDELNPNSTYGLSKKFAEEIIERYNRWYGIRGLIYRISNIYGPGCRPYYNSVISTFLDKIKTGDSIVINGNGEQCRDFIYISDLMDAFSKSLEFNYKQNEKINICSGSPMSINDIIGKLSAISNLKVDVEYIRNNEETNYLIGDPSKAQKILRFQAKTGIEEGLQRIIDNMVG